MQSSIIKGYYDLTTRDSSQGTPSTNLRRERRKLVNEGSIPSWSITGQNLETLFKYKAIRAKVLLCNGKIERWYLHGDQYVPNYNKERLSHDSERICPR